MEVSKARFVYGALTTPATTVAASTAIATTVAVVAAVVIPTVRSWCVARATIIAEATTIETRTIIAIAAISGITHGTANVYARRAAAKEQPEAEDAKQGNQRFYTHD
jgi:hypothetical protein